MTTNQLGTFDPYTLADPYRPTGAIQENFPRANIAASQAPTSGTPRFSAGVIRAGETLTSITVSSGNTAANGPTNQWMCLCDQNMNILRFTDDKLTAAWSGSTRKTFTFTTPFNTTYTGLYYAGLMVAVSVTMPNISGDTLINSTAVQWTPILSGETASVSLTTVASAPQAAFPALSAAGGVSWFYWYVS